MQILFNLKNHSPYKFFFFYFLLEWLVGCLNIGMSPTVGYEKFGGNIVPLGTFPFFGRWPLGNFTDFGNLNPCGNRKPDGSCTPGGILNVGVFGNELKNGNFGR